MDLQDTDNARQITNQNLYHWARRDHTKMFGRQIRQEAKKEKMLKCNKEGNARNIQ